MSGVQCSCTCFSVKHLKKSLLGSAPRASSATLDRGIPNIESRCLAHILSCNWVVENFLIISGLKLGGQGVNEGLKNTHRSESQSNPITTKINRENRPYANCVEAPGIFYNDLLYFSHEVRNIWLKGVWFDLFPNFYAKTI